MFEETVMSSESLAVDHAALKAANHSEIDPIPSIVSHTFKSSYGQCKCLWCGRHSGYCAVTVEIRTAICNFAENYGHKWKSTLRHCWETGNYAGIGSNQAASLQQFRNVAGPSVLAKLAPGTLRRHRERMKNAVA
jgi:hypothetical protein